LSAYLAGIWVMVCSLVQWDPGRVVVRRLFFAPAADSAKPDTPCPSALAYATEPAAIRGSHGDEVVCMQPLPASTDTARIRWCGQRSRADTRRVAADDAGDRNTCDGQWCCRFSTEWTG
jgi:hypothetical protein